VHEDRRTPIRPSTERAIFIDQINGHPAPGRLRYKTPCCHNSTLLPFAGEAPWMFSMVSGAQRSAVNWRNHPSLHLWTCPRVKGKQ
jgi:hypothetical protein